MSQQIEVIWDDNDGTFSVHFAGYAVHDDEHKEVDRIRDGLIALGFKPKLEHFHSGQNPQGRAVANISNLLQKKKANR